MPESGERFRKYLLRDGQPVSFRYEGRDYNIVITEVSVFPQGYAAILTQGELLKEACVVVGDLGGWTDASAYWSLELGVIRYLDEIEKQARRKTGLSVTIAQIESVLCAGNRAESETPYGKSLTVRQRNTSSESFPP